MFDFLRDLPFAIIRTIGELLEWMFMSLFSARDPDEPSRPIWLTILLLPFLLPYWILRLLLFAISYPFEYFMMDELRSTRFIRGIPAVCGMVAILGTAMYAWVTTDQVTLRYYNKMQVALNDNNYKLASTIGGRLVSQTRERDPSIALKYAYALANSGNTAQATAIINDLAPNNTAGFAPAHQLRALQLATQAKGENDIESLELLRWHLSNCGNVDDEQVQILWAGYYQRVGQLNDAIEKLEQAAKKNPVHLFAIANLQIMKGNRPLAETLMKKAELEYRRRLGLDPLNRQARVQLALALTRLTRIDEAEQVLLTGLHLHKDPEMRTALADFYLMRYDVGNQEGLSFEKRFDFLERAIKLDVNFVPTYDRLIQLYSNNKNEAERNELVQMLEGMIVDGKNIALAHWAMSSILLIDGKPDAATMHLRQAMQIDNRFPAVSNNLAWILATRNPPMLDEAYELASQAVEANPNSPTYRDTLGTVLLRQGKTVEAITQFEKAMEHIKDKKQIHRKLAAAYQSIGQIGLAKMHADRADKDGK